MKKFLTALLAVAMLTMAGCSSDEAPASSTSTEGGSSEAAPASDFDMDNEITVISREDGSGTRGAFVELMGVLVDDVDMTTVEAIISNKTDAVMTGVAQDEYAIGYISLGSLNDTIKAVSVDGVAPSSEAIIAGEYKVARPFNIAVKDDSNPLAQDFISFIMSSAGQEIVADGYIPVSEGEYTASNMEGRLVVGGSTSVTPVMEALGEAYTALNPNVVVEVQGTGSSAGMTGAIDGTLDIGMASRNLKDSELAELTATAIAQDGIAVIVNNENPMDAISAESIKNIYLGEVTEWSAVK